MLTGLFSKIRKITFLRDPGTTEEEFILELNV